MINVKSNNLESVAGGVLSRAAAVLMLVAGLTFAASNAARAEFMVADTDIGETLVLDFDGNVDGTTLDGLTATIELTLDAVEYHATEDITLYFFTSVLINTTNPILFQEARISAFGLDTGGYCSDGYGTDTNGDGVEDEFTCVSDPNWQEELLGVGPANGAFDTRVIGGGAAIFTDDYGGSFPNNFGSIDVCFTSGGSCSGGGGTGVGIGDTGEFSFVLAFSGEESLINLSNLGIRWQSLNSDYYGLFDDSGTGRLKVSEPGTLALMGLGLAGAGVLRRRRRLAPAA